MEYISTWIPATTTIAISITILITCVGGCSFLIKKKKAKSKQKAIDDFVKFQKKHPNFPVLIPGKDKAPLLTGVRVVSLSTVVAAPSAARCLAEHGAEVIKVEAVSLLFSLNPYVILSLTLTFTQFFFFTFCLYLLINLF